MSKLTSLIRRAPKRFSAVIAMIAAAVIVPTMVLASWGPDRPTYDWNGPAADHVVFNSFTNNPAQGDERNFMQVREASASASTYTDNIALQANKEYVINIYYHNNASTTLNDAAHGYKGVAVGAYIKAQIPGLVAKGSTRTVSQGYIGAANASPKEVWDDVAFSNSTSGDLALTYVPGSATLHNFGKANGAKLSDSIVTSGAPIGYDALDGKVPGCNEFSGYVTFVVKTTQSNFSVDKQVRVQGQTEYKENVTAKAGDTLEYRIEYKNTGTLPQTNVVVKDVLPKNVNYIAGSTTLKNANNPNGKTVADGVTTTGINIGDYAAGSNAYVKFNAKVAVETALACGVNTLVNKASVQVGTSTKDDTATTTVTKTCIPNINVCELATGKIVIIKETDFNSTKYSKKLADCKKITVCELSTKKIVTIIEKDFNTTKYSKNLDDCKTPEKMVVCELSTKKIVTILKKDFNTSKYSKNLDDCKTPEEITVCELSTKKIVTILEKDFNTSKYSKNLDDCKEVPPVTPPELPTTGATENIVAVIGLGAMIASIAYYAASRRALNQ